MYLFPYSHAVFKSLFFIIIMKFSFDLFRSYCPWQTSGNKIFSNQSTFIALVYCYPIWPDYYDNFCGNRSPHKLLWVACAYYQNLFFIFIECLYFIRQTFYISIAQYFLFFVYNSFILTLASFLKLTYLLCRQHVHLNVVLSMANIYNYRKSVGVWNVCNIIHSYVSFKIPSAWIKILYTDSKCVNQIFIQESQCVIRYSKCVFSIMSRWITSV